MRPRLPGSRPSLRKRAMVQIQAPLSIYKEWNAESDKRFNAFCNRRGKMSADPQALGSRSTDHFLPAVIIGKLSVRKGEAGRPSLFQRLTIGKSAQPYRTATGLGTAGL